MRRLCLLGSGTIEERNISHISRTRVALDKRIRRMRNNKSAIFSQCSKFIHENASYGSEHASSCVQTVTCDDLAALQRIFHWTLAETYRLDFRQCLYLYRVFKIEHVVGVVHSARHWHD